MWIVRLALRRPYTFVVGALLLLVLGVASVRQTPKDIFPEIDIPVISVVWTYSGLPAQQMEQQIAQFSEFSLAGNIAGIRTIETQSFDGIAAIKLYFHEGTDVAAAMAGVTAQCQTILRRMPPGTLPPIIVRYSATSVPILQLSFTSDTLSEAEIYDHVNRRVRASLSAVQGSRFPAPMGGRERLIAVDLDLEALRAHGLSPDDVNVAIASQNLTLPTGTTKLGDTEYRVSLNSSPEAISALNDLPIRRRTDGAMLFVRDVAHVHDGFATQTTIARQDGRRAVVLSVLKTGDTSTLDVADQVKAMLPTLRASAPEGLRIELLADQSTFVTHAISGLVIEALIAGALTATMILLFLGSWRSTLIVAISIPLSVLAALLVMRALGHTLNTMTLGGLALAVGILVDDATVTIENIHRHLHQGKRLTRGILDGAKEIATPAFVASLAISIVFSAVLLLEGSARYLFLPMGLAVALSVMASYLLSRTLVPTLVKYLLAAELTHAAGPRRGAFARIHLAFDRGFQACQRRYSHALATLLRHRHLVLAGFAALAIGAGVGLATVGRDFFPVIDAGQLRLHINAAPGTRIEETERAFARVEAAIAELIPQGERETMIAQIGLPAAYSLAVTDSANVSGADGELLVRLRSGHATPTGELVTRLRAELPRRFPELRFYFQPADMVTQVLNFGLPAPIDVQISGGQPDKALAIARRVEAELRDVPGLVDVRLHQIVNAPRLHFAVDRTRALQVGLSQRDIASNLLLAVGSSGQVAPNYWTDPRSGIGYPVSVQVPPAAVRSLDELLALPLATALGMQQLRDVASVERRPTPAITSRVDVQPTFNVRADVAGADLASVAAHVDAIVAAHRAELPPGGRLTVRGQIESMRSAFGRLGLGIALATLLVFALLVVNFQSWSAPLIILAALPGAGAGIVLSLWLTGNTLNVPSLMGAIMSIGVATANSILVVAFADERRAEGAPALRAALDAGEARLRPVIMTALAMIIGMLPMAMNLGEGGEQNAALARAVIGGLAGATLTTLFIVPALFAVVRRRDRVVAVDPDLADDAH